MFTEKTLSFQLSVEICCIWTCFLTRMNN